MNKLIMLAIGMMLVSTSSYSAEDTVSIERERSRDAKIGHVYLQPSSDALMISGYINKTMNRRGHIPGHIHVNIYDEHQKLLLSDVTDYHRHRTNSRNSHFYGQYPVLKQDVSKVVITHHGMGEAR